MYADDIVMFSSSPQGLQQKLNSLEKYCDDWGKFIPIKQKLSYFTKPGEQSNTTFSKKL